MHKYQPLHSQVKRIKNLRQGQTVYTVHAVGKVSFLQKHIITGKPYIQDGWFKGIDYKRFTFEPEFLRGYHNSHVSLEDMNVIPNSYNEHRLFTSRRKAESYLKLCKELEIDSSNKESDDWGWDDWDDYFDEAMDKVLEE